MIFFAKNGLLVEYGHMSIKKFLSGFSFYYQRVS